MMRPAMSELDHVVINTLRNMDAAQDCFAALGFTLTPRGHHSLGSINHLMMTRGAYLELVGVPETGRQRQDVLESPFGLNGLVLRSADADATYSNLMAAGLPAQQPVSFSRPVTVDGGEQDARFRTVRLPGETFPAGRVYFCQHLTPDLVWRPEWLEHPNGFRAINRLIVGSPDGASEAGRYAALAGSAAQVVPEGWRIPLADADIQVVPAQKPRFLTVELLFDGLGEIERRARKRQDVEWTRHSASAATLVLPDFDLTLMCRSRS